jgi:hypothetical protein
MAHETRFTASPTFYVPSGGSIADLMSSPFATMTKGVLRRGGCVFRRAALPRVGLY